MQKQPNRDEEIARQLERDADDDALWEQEPVKIERRPSRTSVLSLRLPTAEFHALLRAARQVGESASQYGRNAISARIATQAQSTFVTATWATVAMPRQGGLLEWRTLTAGSAQQEAPQSSH